MKARLQQYENNLAVLRTFVAAYGDRIPEEMGTLSPGESYAPAPRFTIYLDDAGEQRATSETNRERALTLAGQVFGVHGWISTMNRDRNAFNWETSRHGVSITIHNAALITEPRVSFPVPASAFPIQLEDAAPATE